MHSGLICLDFDHVENIMELKQKLLNHEYFDTELLFVSPSGNGLKWIIPVDLKGWEYSRYFKAVTNCIKATGLPLVDMSGSDVARSCFCHMIHKHILTLNTKMMSKKIFFAQDWENVPSEIQQTDMPSITPLYNKVEEDVEHIVREIEQRAIDITPNYKDWVELGFALVDGLGENGREYYHRISRFYLTIKGRNRQTIYTLSAIQRTRYYHSFFLPSCKPSRNLAGSIQQRTFIHFAKYPKWENG